MILEDKGYIYKGDAGIPGRHFLKKDIGDCSTHYIHILDIDSKQWKDMILFIDYLNSNPELVEKYSTLKQNLEQSCSDNRKLYTKNKDPFIQEVLNLANK